MSKSYACQFLDLVGGFLLEATALDPTLDVSCKKDFKRLISLVEEQGLAVFTLSLPAICKALDQGLDTERLATLNLPLAGRCKNGSVIPRLFQGIWLRLFTHRGNLRQTVDPSLVACFRSILMIGNKFQVDCSTAAKFAAIKEYFDVESTLPPSPSLWDGDGSDLDRESCGHILDRIGSPSDRGDLFECQPEQVALLTRAQLIADRFISGTFGNFSPEDLEFRHGPGATAEFGRGKSYKYDFPNWSPRLESLYPYDRFGVANSAVLAGPSVSFGAFHYEVASRLISVPKTAKGPRLIAAEPSCNQWVQQGLLHYMVKSLSTDRHYLGRCIDFSNQRLSQRSARLASRTGTHATIDLKSASDRLTTWLVQRIFRSHPLLLSSFIASRTRILRNDLDKKQDSDLKMRKFASMGSALTFPVQSVVFTILALTAGSIVDETMDRERLLREVRTYGDDIVIPVRWVGKFETLLDLLWLVVNRAKTFTGKNFRESCGYDAFRGYDVTPVKIKRLPEPGKPSTIISAVDTSNLLFKKGWWLVAQRLDSAVDVCMKVHVVHRLDGTWGRQTTSRGRYPYRKVWNHDTQKFEVSLLQPKAVEKVRGHSEGVSNLLQFFTEDPVHSQISVWESGNFGTSEAGYCRRRVASQDLILA